MKELEVLIGELGGMDLWIYNAGVNSYHQGFSWESERETLAVNNGGFLALVHTALRHFLNQGHGHLVGISSIAAMRGAGRAPVYNASKAFLSNYLEGIRQRLSRTAVSVTDVRPGFVDTAMIRNMKPLFWVARPQKAARQIADAIRRKKKVVCVTKRWILIAWLWKLIPEGIYNGLYHKHGAKS